MAAKGRRRQKKKSGDEEVNKIYLCNLNFVPPKDQNLETIFEEPRQSKDGEKILTSKIKYKRYLNFDPTTNKIQKRKRKAKKCMKNFKSAYRVTRSSPQASERDISVYIDILSDSSSDSSHDTLCSGNYSDNTRIDTPVVTNTLPTDVSSFCPKQDESCSDVFDTPKKSKSGFRRTSELLQEPSRLFNLQDETESSTFTNDTQETTVADDDITQVESPRKSCIVS